MVPYHLLTLSSTIAGAALDSGVGVVICIAALMAASPSAVAGVCELTLQPA